MIVYEWILNLFVFGLSLGLISLGAFILLILMIGFKDIVQHKWNFK